LVQAMRPFIAEFIGTFFFAFASRTLCSVGDALWNAIAIGCMLTICVYVFGSGSVEGPAAGGHLNPAVSLASLLAGKEPPMKVMFSIVVQCSGGLLAGRLSSEVFPKHVAPMVGAQPSFAGTISPCLVEAAFTSALCFVVLNVCYSRRNNPADDQNHFFALAIGLLVVAGGYAAGDISGACFNPAVALSLEATSSSVSWTRSTYNYIISEGIGAVIAAMLFRACRPEEDLENVDGYDIKLRVKVLSEFVGTFVLTLTVGLCVVLKSPATPLAAAAALTCMIYTLWDVSGAHFNPAVTVAVFLSDRGKCPAPRAMAYIIVQVIAGILAGFVVASVHYVGPYHSEDFCLKPLQRVGAGGVMEGYWLPALFAELLFTFLLAFTVLAVATVRPLPIGMVLTRQNFPFGFAIGACVTAGGFAASKASGGELNPAVAVAISVNCAIDVGLWSPLPACGSFALLEAAGGVLAAFVFRLTHPGEFGSKYDA